MTEKKVATCPYCKTEFKILEGSVLGETMGGTQYLECPVCKAFIEFEPRTKEIDEK